MFNVLVFPGGTEVGLEIYRALCRCKDIRLYSAGLDVSNHALYVFARPFTIPSYGIIELDDKGKARSVEEKPVEPKSPFAIPGLSLIRE